MALAAVRATREAQVARGRDKLPSILGTPASGEMANGEAFDGDTEVATFPGDLLAGTQPGHYLRDCGNNPLKRLADPARFELTTSAFGGQRSIQLSYGSSQGRC